MKLWELLSPRSDRLDELLNQPLDWAWVVKRQHGWIASFYPDGDRIDVTLSMGDGVDIIDIMFSSKESGLDISGAGHQFKIFATVAAIIRDFFKSNPLEPIRFSAKEASRSKLYRRFSDMIAKELGWKVTTQKMGHDTVFQIEPKNQVNEWGVIVPNVNTTCDVHPGEIQRQAAKFGNTLDAKGRPPLLSGSYGDDSARFSANQGDPLYGPNGTRLKRE